ncbi:MAG TPA: DegV family protein [Chloroflexi bacterium]|jgi:DegV family protein with EDD domain|nr:DegV family protein [Chloroflexota bacterium]HPO58645.1 DegV family protein [Anaerolineaceae bacterium]
MRTVHVVTDSCASIPEPLMADLPIKTVAYYIHRGKEVLRDLVTIQREEFIEWLRTAETLPTTASPGPGDYYAAVEELVATGIKDIVSIHITSKGSGAYQAASVAREMALERIPGLRWEVIDTLNVSMCQGWMVLEAARAALAGCTLEEIVALVKNLIPRARMIQTADTLKYLYKGGRIGKAQHLVGSMFNIKPLISLKDGVVVALGVERSRPRAYRRIAELVERDAGPGGRIKAAFVHAGAREEVEELRALVESRVECVESIIAELSPVLSVHSGPGTAGVCYYTLP